MKTFGRILFRLIRVAIMLLPLVILVRGFVYLRQCVNALAAPGVGLDFKYEARKGAILHITADSYSFLWQQGVLQVIHPRLQDPQGQLLAGADSARIQGLHLNSNGTIDATVRRLRGKLVRLRNGHFAFEEYLPEQTTQTQKRPYHVLVQGVDLQFEDQSGKGNFDQRAVSNELVVDGLAQDWIASGTFALPQVGVANVSVQRYRGSGLLIALKAQQLNLGRVLDHFRTTPEGKNIEPLRQITAQTLQAQGPVRLFFPEKNPFELAASLNVKGTNVVYGGKDRFDVASFDGLVTGSGASGTLIVSRGGSHGKFVGSTDWSHSTRFAGQIEATAGSRRDIPPSLVSALPSSVVFSGASAHGWFSFDKKYAFRYDGDLNAESITVSGQKFGAVSGAMRAGDGLVRIEGAQGNWQGSLLHGSLAYFPKDQKILGLVGGPQVQLASLSKAAHISGLSGTAAGQALLSGTMKAPVAAIRASGMVAFRAPHATKTLNGSFSGAGNYSASGLDLTSLAVDTKTGTVAATGHADLRGKLAMTVAARGVSIDAFAPKVGGSASFSGTVSGTASDPYVVGKAQVVGLTIAERQVPLLVANLTANKERIQATSIDAARGAAQANGQLAYTFANGGIAGSLTATNVPLSELSDQIGGVIDISKSTISGTLDSPAIDADLETHAMVIMDRTVGKGKASVSLRGNDFKIPNITADFAGGKITGSASGNIKTKQTHLDVDGKDLSIPDLIPQASQTATLDGKVSGNAVIGLSGSTIRYARAKGTAADVTVNQTLVGNGSWNAAADPKAYSGSVLVGSLDRYLDMSSFFVDRKSDAIGANFTAFHIPLQDIYSAAQRYIPDPTSDIERRLLRVQGTADAVATISGTTKDPDLKVNELDLTNLSLESKDLGQMKFSFSKAGRVWTVAEASWNGVAGTLRSSGAFDLDKNISYEGDFVDVDLGLLSILDDNLTRVGGRAALSFAVSGPTQSPVIQASLDASRTTVLASTGTTDAVQLAFGMVLDTINVSQSTVGPDGKLVGGIEAGGKLFYRGLEGNISAQIPLKYPFAIPQGDPLMVALDFPQRNIQTLADYLPALDMKKTDGTIQGNLALTGPAGSAKINGNLKAKAKTLGMNKVQTNLNDLTASAQVNSDALTLHLDGTGSEGGSILFDASSPIGAVSDRIKELASRGVDSLLDRPVDGSLALTDFGVRYNGGANNGRLVAKANAKIKASGAIRQPAITGDARVSGVDTVLPTFDVSSAAPEAFAIDPTFNVNLHMDDVGTVSTSLAKLKMIGDGLLSGSLNKPSVSSNMTVMGGTVKLPTASVRIDPGGTVRLRYQTSPSGDTNASVDVDFTGHTSLTTLDAGDIPQHYDITLTIRGDLLTEGQTYIVAESDPPGLPQDRILALLGQADLIQALAGSVSSFQASRELRNALAGIALPALLSPLTGAFAKGLGLDYLNISYDPLSQVSLSFAKEIGKNFSLQGTRQVSQPLPGIKAQYDLRLVYRLPFRSKNLRRTTVIFGTDQDRPWKIGVQYGFRF
jgi:hypothetical protein